MDKILNELEKQRRAESIYLSRRNIASTYEQEDVKRKSGYKILFDILLIINIGIIMFCLQNTEYVFKDEFVADVNVFIQNIKKRANESDVILENVIENTVNKEVTISEPIVEKTAEELEIEALIGMYQFKTPLVGVVTSRFGEKREDEYHTGIDIAAEQGTDIKSSVTGIVTLVSDIGDYGKQVRIRNNNMTTLYAHCSEILVKEGDIVADGQVIARVGNTGNSTGPHLHFEIRVDDRCLDPGRLVKF